MIKGRPDDNSKTKSQQKNCHKHKLLIKLANNFHQVALVNIKVDIVSNRL